MTPTYSYVSHYMTHTWNIYMTDQHNYKPSFDRKMYFKGWIFLT